MLEQHRRSQRVNVALAAPGRAALLPNNPEGAGGAHSLVPELQRQFGPALEGACYVPRRPRVVAFGSLGGKGKTDNDADRMMEGGELEKARHGKTLALAADQSLEGGGEHLRFITQGEADPELTPVDSEDATGCGNGHGAKIIVSGKR